MRIHSRLIVAALLAMFTALASAAYDVRMVGIVFDPGSDTAELADQITGDESVMYRFRPREGQILQVSLRPENDHTQFIVYAPGKWPGDVLHDSERSGSRDYRGRVDKDGFHAVSVFQDQAAIAEGRTSRYELVIRLTDAAD